MKKFLSLFLLASSVSGFAGGFQLNVQSTRSLGMGGAYTGFGRGTESVFFNPGAMCNLKGHNFTLGGTLIMPLVSLQTDVFDNINQTSPMATPIHFYYGGQITDDLFLGLGINNQFGSSSSFEDDWQGRFIIQNISLKTFTFQPTVAYKIHELVSLGAGFVITTRKFAFEKALPITGETTDEGKAVLSGSGVTYGFNAGLFSTLIDNDKMKLTLGVDYRSGQTINLENGLAQFSDIPVSLQESFPAETKFTGKLNLPSVFGLYKPFRNQKSIFFAANFLRNDQAQPFLARLECPSYYIYNLAPSRHIAKRLLGFLPAHLCFDRAKISY